MACRAALTVSLASRPPLTRRIGRQPARLATLNTPFQGTSAPQLARLVGCWARGDPDLDRFDAPEWDSSELGPQEGDKDRGAPGAAAAGAAPTAQGGTEGRKAAEGPAAATQAAGASPTLETDSPAGTSQHPGEAPPPSEVPLKRAGEAESTGGTLDAITREHPPHPYHGEGVGRREDVRR